MRSTLPPCSRTLMPSSSKVSKSCADSRSSTPTPEMKIYISGNPVPIQREFKRDTDIVSVQKTLADHILT